jgi:hypothetical protein
MTAAGLAVITYPTTEEKIAEARDKYAGLTADTPANYKRVVEAIAVLRGTRTAVEKRRVALKADALDFGRRVDAAAKHLTALVIAIEEPLQDKKKAADDEEARLKREAEKAELVALEAKLRAEREAEEARLKAQREQQAAEQKRLDDERKALEDQKRAQAAEAARLEAERIAALPPAPVLELPLTRAAPPPFLPVPVVVPVPPPTPTPTPAPVRHMAAVTDIAVVRSFADEIRALAASAPDVDGPCIEAIKWAVGRLESIATGLDAFKVPGDDVPIT